MDDPDEPPFVEQFTQTEDLEGILLEPNKADGELAVLNPSVIQDSENGNWPFVYRTEIPDRKFENERYSIIDFRLLEAPTKLSREKRTILKPEPETEMYDFECRGCEDPRITKIKDVFYITYVAFDGLNARVAYATTKDFQTIEKHGIISPQITLEEAIEIVGNKSYKRKWIRDLKEARKRLRQLSTKSINSANKQLYVWDKNAVISYNEETKKWILEHRLDPDSHVAFVDNLEDLKNDDFWKDYLKNINQHIRIKPEEPWEKEKTGWGSKPFKLKDKYVCLYHGMQKLNDESCVYSVSFVEIEPFSYKILSKLKDPLIQPTEDDDFRYEDENGKLKKKKVIFSTDTLIQRNRLWVYSGSGDTKIKYRSTNVDWLYKELNHPHNRFCVESLAS